jgi:hypothetical protein
MPLAEKIVKLILKDGTRDGEAYEALVNVITTLCMCTAEPLSSAQEVAGDIVRVVTERVMESE